MNALVDTSVWVGHFKQRDEQLLALLKAGMVACHPYVVVEVACGTPPQRNELIELLRQLESLPVATADELLVLLQQHALHGRGCSFVDISLLASTLLSEKAVLWTLDKRLETLAMELGCSYRPALAS